ncbi:universal stress protein [Thiomicrospira microaerophila]|uniref:universal stress protein n=1 Tax=Thiomicrospira microaerophila TaxID=406020 RepID=UPI00200C88F2|nr:universal stress protein [Thiomicrospira microaerophila]UQB41297.1 universal stress protein [Thiomicrospira microaerophila]
MEALEQKWVMACIDGSTMTNAVVDTAAWIAQKVNSPLELMHTIEHGLLLDKTDRSASFTPNMRENLMLELSEEERTESKRLIAEGKQMLETQKQRLKNKLSKEIITKQRHGDLSDALQGVENEIRVLVIGLRGEDHGNQEQAIGAQLEATIRALHKPIYIVNGAYVEPKSLMLAYNDTDAARQALKFVCESPLYAEMEIHLVHVNDKSSIGQPILEAAEVALKRSGRHYKTALLSGDAQTALINYQATHDIDLTVMGAFSHGALHKLFFGSFTLKMLMHSHKSMLLIR